MTFNRPDPVKIMEEFHALMAELHTKQIELDQAKAEMNAFNEKHKEIAKEGRRIGERVNDAVREYSETRDASLGKFLPLLGRLLEDMKE